MLKPTGSLFVNLGDKFAGSGGHNNAGISTHGTGKSTLQRNRVHSTISDSPDLARRQALAEELKATRRNAPDRYNQASDGIPAKSRMALPWRYAIRCIDELGLILRADIIWSKPNGLPESVTDRVRMSHEYLFHFTRQGRYFAAIDEVREEHAPWTLKAYEYEQAARAKGADYNRKSNGDRNDAGNAADYAVANPLGKVPGSVWQIASEPLTVPDHLGVDHFAAFPSELPRRCILGWCPRRVCSKCGSPQVESKGESSTTALRGMRESDHREPPLGSGASDPCGEEEPLLFEAVLVSQYGAQSDLDQIPPPDDEGLRRSANAAPSDGEQGRVSDGASAGDGRPPRPDAAVIGGCPPQERGQDGQPHREPRADAEEGPRPATEASAEALRLPTLRRDDAVVREPLACSHCGGSEFKPGVVADFFAGTGTTVAVAHHLGRHAIGTDLSRDYLRLAEWRCTSDSRLKDKVLDRTGIPNPVPARIDGQLDLFGETA